LFPSLKSLGSLAGMALELAETYMSDCERSCQVPDSCAIHDDSGNSHRRVMSELNRSGKYLEMRQRLKTAVRTIAVELFGCPPEDARPDTDGALYNSLYACAIDEIHSVLNVLRGEKTRPETDEARDEKELQRLEHLAAECEVCSDQKRADALHRDRCASSNPHRAAALTCVGTSLLGPVSL
jgi:hypothetical protein